MKFFVRKANDDYWYKIEEYTTLEELLKSIDKRHHDYIIGKNHCFATPPESIVHYWDNKMTLEDAEKICQIKYEITIYNGYME